MKATTNKPLACELWNERQASLAMAQSSEQTKQDGLRAINHQLIDDENERKQAANQVFWHRVWVGCNVLLLLIIAYAAVSFFGGLYV